jgi:hypothetical protein
MKPFGNNTLFLVALLFVFSCKQYKFDTTGGYRRGYLSNYSNDKISLLYGVNVGFSQTYIRTDTFYDKKVDKKILSILNFNTSNTTVLFSSISPMEAPIHTIGLYYKGAINHNLYKKNLVKDSLFFFKRTLFHHRYLITESLIPFENGYVITVYYLPIILKNETTELILEQIVEHDALQNTERIFNKLRD